MTALAATESMTTAAAAAAAAAPLIPSALPLTVVPDATEVPDPAADAFVAAFTGATSGEVLLVVDEAVVAALSGSRDNPMDVADAVRPALDAAAQSFGPCVLGPVRQESLAQLGSSADVDIVALGASGAVSAWVGLRRKPVTATGPGGAATPAGALSLVGQQTGLHLLRDVEMTLSVEIGRARMTVRDLLSLVPGSVVELDRAAGSPADLLVNGRLIARGEIVVVDEDFGLRITEIVQATGETTT